MTDLSGMLVVWIIAFVVLVGVELSTMGLTSIWFALGAVAAAIAAALHAPELVQLLIFIGVSFAALFAVRPFALKVMNKEQSKTNVDSLAGKKAVVIQAIDNLHNTGKVTLDGMEWTARSTVNETLIPVDTIVEVCAVDGVKLIVTPQAEEKQAEPEQATENS